MIYPVWMDCVKPTVLSNAVAGRCTVPIQSSDASAWLIDNGKRLHLQHGPIDLIVECIGIDEQVMIAYRQATKAFDDVLQTLADELPLLRTGSCNHRPCAPFVRGPVALRMMSAVKPFSGFWMSPMISVAGAVADYILGKTLLGTNLQRVMVNNGGDIALKLNSGSQCQIGICPDLDTGVIRDRLTLDSRSDVGGVATSGWRGRSHSLGIADAVTVLASDAATADVAATLIANAVNLPDSKAIQRTSARELNPDSDLGNRLVTTRVTTLSREERRKALKSGKDLALRFYNEGLISAACLNLQGQIDLVGHNKLLQQNH